MRCLSGRGCSKSGSGSGRRLSAVAPGASQREHGDGRGLKGGKERGEEEVTWRDVAKGWDYVFSRIFLLIILVATVVCLAVLIRGKP